jgi:nucleotide-binding universal stress UspA family protein
MVTKNEIAPTGKSDIVPSRDSDKESQEEIMSIHNTSNSEFESNIPQFNKVLVTYDGSKKSDKAINYSIYLSNISKAEIVILQVLENIDKLENSYIDVSNRNMNVANSDIRDQNYCVNIEGNIVKLMEDKIKDIESTGFKNRVSYKIRSGFVVGEIVKETKESKYDLLIISSSHIDSWIKSLFSETRKIISNIDLPVLLLH